MEARRQYQKERKENKIYQLRSLCLAKLFFKNEEIKTCPDIQKTRDYYQLALPCKKC